MFRPLAIAAIAAASISGAAFAAEPVLTTTVSSTQMRTADGRAQIKAKLTEEVKAYCQAKPAGTTVKGCRNSLMSALNTELEQQAARQPGTRLASNRR